jgi:hypothetical protein
MTSQIPTLFIKRAILDVARKNRSFDSHDVIKRFIERYSGAYHAALQKLQGRRSPVHALHTLLGCRIAKICQQLGYQRQQSRSSDIHGQHSRCLRWV